MHLEKIIAKATTKEIVLEDGESLEKRLKNLENNLQHKVYLGSFVTSQSISTFLFQHGLMPHPFGNASLFGSRRHSLVSHRSA